MASETSTAIAPVETEAPEGVVRSVLFIHEQSKRGKQEYLAAGGKVNTFALVGNGLQVQIGEKLAFHPVSGVRLATKTDRAGKVIEAVYASQFPGDLDAPGCTHQEHFFVVGILADSYTPFCANFRGSSAKVVKNAFQNLRIASNPEQWKSQGPGFEAAAACPAPEGRLVASATLTPKVSKTTGNTYLNGNCTVRPTTADEVTKITNAFKDGFRQASLEACIKAHEYRVARTLKGDTEEEV